MMNLNTSTEAPNTTETAIGFIPCYRLPFLSLFHADCMDIMKQYPDKVFEGVDLKIGGKGMKGFYGEPSEGKEGIVGGVAKALVKELTGKPAEIVETKVETGGKEDIYSITNNLTGNSVGVS